MSLRVPLSILLLLCAAAFVACGGGGDDDSIDGPARGDAENDLAAAMVLDLADLPAGWTQDPPDTDEEEEEDDNPINDCDIPEPNGKTGEAESPDFSGERFSTITQRLVILEDEDAARAVLDEVDDISDCIGAAIGQLEDEDFEFGDSSVEDFDVPGVGDDVSANRIILEAEYVGEDEAVEFDELEFFFDIVAMRVDRVVSVLITGDLISPFDEVELLQIMLAAEGKIEVVLAGGVPDDDDDSTAAPSSESTTPPVATAEEPSQNTGPGSSRENPVPFGQTGVVADRMQVVVTAVDFDAEPVILAENQFNDPAEPGNVMVLVTLEVTNVGDAPLDVFFEPFFYLVGRNALVYEQFDPSCGLVPDELDGELFTGGMVTGNVCLQAAADDDELVFFVELFDDETFEEIRTFFALR